MAGYWKEHRNSILCRDWQSANRLQQFSIYNQLYTPLYTLILNVMHRYFSVPTAKQLTYLNDCMQDIFINLHNYQYPKSSFSYCGTLARNWFYDIMVRQPQSTSGLAVQLEFSDTYDLCDTDVPMYIEEQPLDVQAVLMRLQQRKVLLVESIGKTRTIQNDYSRKLSIGKYESLIRVLDLISEYVQKYDNCDAYSVAEYVSNVGGFNEGTLSLYFKELFGIHLWTNQHNKFNTEEHKVYSIVQDDYCPDVTWGIKSRINKSKHKLDNNEYLYF